MIHIILTIWVYFFFYLEQFMPSSSQRDAIGRMLDAEELLAVKNDFIIEEEQGILVQTLIKQSYKHTMCTFP